MGLLRSTEEFNFKDNFDTSLKLMKTIKSIFHTVKRHKNIENLQNYIETNLWTIITPWKMTAGYYFIY